MSEEEIEEEKQEEQEEVKETPRKRRRLGPLQKKILFIVLVVLLIAGISSFLTVAYLRINPEPFGLLKGPALIKVEEKAIVDKISKSLTLPEGEDPTMATVTEPEKLSGQFFFKDAKKGDKLLIYQNAKKVILYRPSENRVVEVGVVDLDKQPAANNLNTSITGIPIPSTASGNLLQRTSN